MCSLCFKSFKEKEKPKKHIGVKIYITQNQLKKTVSFLNNRRNFWNKISKGFPRERKIGLKKKA